MLAKHRVLLCGGDRPCRPSETALERYGAPSTCVSQIVHNTHVAMNSRRAAAIFVDAAESVPEGAVVVFSPKEDIARGARGRRSDANLRTIDAPARGHQVQTRPSGSRPGIEILSCHENHEEVVGPPLRGGPRAGIHW